MAATVPQEIEEVLTRLLPLLLEWHRADTLGEVAIVRGGQEWAIEGRPIQSHGRVKREHKRAGYLEKIGRN